MSRILVFGNSGSGKSTLAKSLAQAHDLSHFDLDSIAWTESDPPQRSAISNCAETINQFMLSNDYWVIEGCYADLIEIATANATEMVFLNLSIEDCIRNAKSRPWEPHKYPSKESQDANLEMLVDWIADYTNRDDSCSLNSHLELFNRFQGKKTDYRENVKVNNDGFNVS